MEKNLRSAMKAWRGFLKKTQVMEAREASHRYGESTEGDSKQILGALLPSSAEEVVSLVKAANRHRVPLYPISTGKNWGYGSAMPVTNGCVIVDLSRMKRILEFNRDLGLVVVEPGVTQMQVYEYLRKNRLPYIISVNGGGKDTSLFGNVLERGFENLPYLQRFTSLVSLEAVLPRGEIYRKPCSNGKLDMGKVYPWGVGPYLEGIFSQGNFGIVTRMTLALYHMPERIEAFSFQIPDDRSLRRFVDAARELRQSIGPMMGLLRVVNTQRLLASIGLPYPHDVVKKGEAISEKVISEIRKKNKLPLWIGAGSVLGPEKTVASLREVVQSVFSPCVKKLTFVTERFPYDSAESLTRPRDVGLVEAYWKLGSPPKKAMDPAKDGCGIIWYAPIVPLLPDPAMGYVEMVDRICREHGIDPEASLIVSSDHYFYGITPLVFNRASREETSRVHRCYEALCSEGKKKGLHPYRIPSHAMRRLVDRKDPFWRFVEKLKTAVDPEGILAPGRYSP